MPDVERTSKFLSLILRHKPEVAGLKLDGSGWIGIDELLEACLRHGHSITRDQLIEIVDTNDKKRFAISDDGRRIRASQGHSINVDLGYNASVPPDSLYHGTATRFLDSIKKQGLQKRTRHHVHLSTTRETASSVGKRYGKLALLEIDSSQMHRDGYEFFLSDNGVWLTDEVPVKYIKFPTE